MPLHFSIPSGLVEFVNQELIAYQQSFKAGDLQTAWRHLERAHILGQNSPYQHTRVHWKMLCFGFRIKSGKEIIGQIPRLIFGGIKTFVGRIPVGNTGGANVPILKPMTIPEDLKTILKQFER